MLRNLPYIHLYINDFCADEKLIECSAKSTGVYIRLMCIMHKSDFYGKILLRQKYQQNVQQIKNFAAQIARQMPWEKEVIADALSELIEEGVLKIEGDFLIQKRMVKDAEISEKRALAGLKGAEKTNKKFAAAKSSANYTANSDNDNDNDKKEEEKRGEGEKGGNQKEQKGGRGEIFSSHTWLTNIAKNNLIDEKEARRLLEKFFEDKDIGEDLNGDSMRDIKAHFANWLPHELNRITKKAKTNENGQPKSKLSKAFERNAARRAKHGIEQNGE